MKRAPVDELIHPCLAACDVVAPDVVREGGPRLSGKGGFRDRNDRERVAVLLQGAGLLASLERGGWRLEQGFTDAWVTSQGRLLVEGGVAGRDEMLVQDRLVELVKLAFALVSETPEVSGRGEARRAARALLDRWRQRVTPLSADLAVQQVLREAPFLWQPRYRGALQALACELHLRGRRRRWLVGPPAARERFLAASSDYGALSTLLTSPEARALWHGDTPSDRVSSDPAALAERGRWRLAIEAFERHPPRTPAERLQQAQCHYSDGRFVRALELLKGRRTVVDRLLRTQCQYQLGELRAARRTLSRLELLELSAPNTVEIGAVALRVQANTGDKKAVRRWILRLERIGNSSAEESLRGRALVQAALGFWDQQEFDSARRCLEKADTLLGPEELDDRYFQARGLLARSDGDAEGAVRWVERAIGGARRRRLRRFEAGRLWNDLLFARTAVGDLAGAERAGHHAYAHLERCDGRAAVTLALPNVAEVRLRRGRLIGVRAIVERSLEENRRSGNVRGGSQDSGLWARYWLAHGEPERALEACRPVLDGPQECASIWQHEERAVLAARALGWLGRVTEASEILERLPQDALGCLEPEERPAVLVLAGRRGEAQAAADDLFEVETKWVWCRALEQSSCAELEKALQRLLSEIEPYRWGRLLLDLRLAGVALPAQLRRAGARALEEAGAPALGERLEPTARAAWLAIEAFLDAAPEDEAAVARLLRDAGHPSARLTWRGADGERLLVDGPGGSVRLSWPGRNGSLELEGADDAPWGGLLRLVADRFRSASTGKPPDDGDTPQAALSRRKRALHSAGRHGIVGSSAALAETLDRLRRLASRDVPVLIQGETGTGKELAARLLHAESPRAGAPFEPINCAAMARENLLLSQLFGHVKGAYTGADRDKPGVFEVARGGTVLLDEIGDLPVAAQGLLLRVLEERELQRLGETRVRRIDVRVLAATHRALPKLVESGNFREDLYYRLAIATVTLPALSEREGDVKELAEHFAARLPGTPHLAPQTLELLAAQSWPGNVRQLRHVIETAVVMAETEEGASDPLRIEPRHLDLPSHGESADRGSYHEKVDAYRRRLIKEALERHSWNKAAAARDVGLTRQAISNLVRQFGLRKP